jgi:hypothetical protein
MTCIYPRLSVREFTLHGGRGGIERKEERGEREREREEKEKKKKGKGL